MQSLFLKRVIQKGSGFTDQELEAMKSRDTFPENKQASAEWLAKGRVALLNTGTTVTKFDTEKTLFSVSNHLTVFNYKASGFFTVDDLEVVNWQYVELPPTSNRLAIVMFNLTLGKILIKFSSIENDVLVIKCANLPKI